MGKIVRLEPLVPIREALVASVQQARAKDLCDVSETVLRAAYDMHKAGDGLSRGLWQVFDQDAAANFATARAAARRVIAVCDEYERVAAACDPEMLGD